MVKNVRKRRPIFNLLVLAFVGVTLLLSRTQAADNITLHIEAGQTVEIGTDTSARLPDFSWILTKDRKFQNAQRTRYFQSRLTQVGTYTLDVSVQNPDGGQNDYRAFTVVVTEPQTTVPPPLPQPEDSPLKAALLTDQPLIDGKIYIPPEGGMVKLSPTASTGKITGYELDLDNTVDSDGDGNPTNDRDNVNTFSEKDGSPLYFFFLPKGVDRKITLTVINASTGQSDSAAYDLVFGPAPATSGPVIQNPNSPIIMEPHGLTVRFSSQTPVTASGSEQLLYEWDFGDQTRSLLNDPVHTYGAPGNYVVSLTIRNILNGQILFAGIQTLPVNPETASSAASQISESASSGAPAGNSSSAGSAGGAGKTLPVGSIIKVGLILFVLLAIAIALYALFTWIKRKTTGSLEKTFERMEQSILKQDPKAAVKAGQAEPMKLKKEPVAEKPETRGADELIDLETSRPEFKSQERDNVTPLKDSGPVPAWLSQSSVKSAALSSGSSPAISPSPQPVTPTKPAEVAPKSISPWLLPEKPVSEPEKAKPQTEKTAAPQGPVPDWLKPSSSKTDNPVKSSPSSPESLPVQKPQITTQTKPPAVSSVAKPALSRQTTPVSEPATSKPDKPATPTTTTSSVTPPWLQPKPSQPSPPPASVSKTAPQNNSRPKTPAETATPKPSAPQPQKNEPQPKTVKVTAPTQVQPATKPQPVPPNPVKPAKPEPPKQTVVKSSPAPAPQLQKIQPEKSNETTQKNNDQEPPIAIIQADSLSKK